MFVLSGAVVVVVSFLLVLPRRVRDAGPGAEAVEDRAELRATPAWLGWLAVVGLVFLCWSGYMGSQEVAENIVPTVFWLLVWIAVLRLYFTVRERAPVNTARTGPVVTAPGRQSVAGGPARRDGRQGQHGRPPQPTLPLDR